MSLPDSGTPEYRSNVALAEIELAHWAADPSSVEALRRSAEIGALMWIDSGEHDASDGRKYEVRGKYAMHKVSGTLVSEGSPLNAFFGLTDYESIARSVIDAESDSSVSEHMLVIDSPGGDTAGLPDLIQVLSSASKPLRAFIKGKSQSAGYWIASAADTIYASETAIIGSLGVVMTSVEVRDDDRSPIKITKIVSNQTPGKLGTKNSDQRLVDDLASYMLGSIATARGLTVDALLEATGGGEDSGASVSARRALAGGLIDGISTLADVVGDDDSPQTSQNPDFVGYNTQTTQADAPPVVFKVGISSSAVHDAVIQASTSSEGVRLPRVVTVTEDEPQITTAPPQVHETTEANTMADNVNHHGDVVARAEFDSAQARIAELEAALKDATATIEGETVTAAALASQVQSIQAEKADIEAQARAAAEEAESLKAEAFNSKVSAALETAHKEGKLAAGEKDHLQACADEDAEVFGRDRALARLERTLSVKAAVVPVGAPAGHDAPAPGASLKARATQRSKAEGIPYADAAKIERRLIAEGK